MVFTTGNTLSFGTPGDKIQQYYGEYKILIFPIISVLSIFSFFAKQRILTITPPRRTCQWNNTIWNFCKKTMS